MTVIIFCIVAVILTTLIIITMSRLGKLENYYSSLLNGLLETNGKVSEQTKRLDAHFSNIQDNQKRIDKHEALHLQHQTLFSNHEDLLDYLELHPIGLVPQKKADEPAVEQPAAENEEKKEESSSEEPSVSHIGKPTERGPYPPEVRKMAEDFIKAECGKSSYKVMSNLLQIPVTTVKRWTKKLIEKGEIAKQ